MEAPSRESYAVGIICALALEMAAVKAILDESFDAPPNKANTSDSNSYSFGQIGSHHVVVACLPAGVMGKVSAASVAMDMMHSFPIKVGLMVGVGGGVWSEKDDVRLGDVVVSQPDGMHGGVVQWDFGKMEAEGRFRRTGTLKKPPTPLLSALQTLKAHHMLEDSKIQTHLTEMWKKHTRTAKTFPYPGASNDNLYEASYSHPSGTSCALCDESRMVQRDTREETTPQVHYGNIASGDEVMKDGVTRDLIAQKEGILCFEMEAAGLMDRFPCVVIRGICDYADSHKNKQWQPYAAATAACYCKELLSVVEPHAIADLVSADQPTVRCEYIPFSCNKKFVDRVKELDMLEKALFTDQSAEHMAIVGLGGVGKTQVALKFAYWVIDNHLDVSVLWVSAMSAQAFEEGCRELARVFGIRVAAGTDVRTAIRQRLSAKNSGRWLMIVDNADDSDILFGVEGKAGLLSYLPKRSGGLVVYTTRNREIAQSLTRNDVVKISCMDVPEATELLRRTLDHTLLDADKEVTAALLNELEYLPLAINQAAAYMNCNEVSLSEYLNLLKGSQEDLIYIMSREIRDNQTYEQSRSAVATTWLVSFKQLLHRDSHAADLLQFMSCIEWKSIPQSILPKVKPAARMRTAVGTLCAYSFIAKREGGKMYDLHRLAHLAAQIWVQQNGHTVEVRERAIEHMAAVFPWDEWKHRELCGSYYRHATQLIDATDPSDREQCVEKGRLCLKVGVSLLKEKRPEEAANWLNRSCLWLQGSKQSEMLLRSLLELAKAYVASEEPEKAVRLIEPSVENLIRHLGQSHPATLASQSVLAEAYMDSGQARQALRLIEHVVASQERLVGNHPNLVESQQRLAQAYTKTGQAAKAAVLLERIIEMEAQVRLEDDPFVMGLQTNLAEAYKWDGQVGKAVMMQKLLSAAHQRMHPGDELIKRSCDATLAGAYIDNEQAPEAVELLEYAVEKNAETLAEDDIERLRSLFRLGLAYQANGQLESALDVLEHVVTMHARVLAEDHPERVASERKLAEARGASERVLEQKLTDLILADRFGIWSGHSTFSGKRCIATKEPLNMVFGPGRVLSRPQTPNDEVADIYMDDCSGLLSSRGCRRPTHSEKRAIYHCAVWSRTRNSRTYAFREGFPPITPLPQPPPPTPPQTSRPSPKIDSPVRFSSLALASSPDLVSFCHAIATCSAADVRSSVCPSSTVWPLVEAVETPLVRGGVYASVSNYGPRGDSTERSVPWRVDVDAFVACASHTMFLRL
ncbi:hypothetical protein LTR10_005409 [Elasticomyces elasticus]|nr:hypothetical protein LTR10_005409 [Elasticomyces elasticus]KAK4976148.1 hypothetical protein LTR42_003773 [Elasticomyces elasticus]